MPSAVVSASVSLMATGTGASLSYLSVPAPGEWSVRPESPGAAVSGMARWLQSGTRRDLCVLLAGAEDGLPAQKLKTRLEAHYDDRIDPSTFYGALEDLERKGFVESRTDGLSDVYDLTAAGERRLRDHADWLREELPY